MPISNSTALSIREGQLLRALRAEQANAHRWTGMGRGRRAVQGVCDSIRAQDRIALELDDVRRALRGDRPRTVEVRQLLDGLRAQG